MDIGGVEDCLFLNVYTPSLTGNRAVMVWIHGGGNVTGAASEWICDPGKLVHRSVELGMPVLVVSTKYVLPSR